MTWWRRRKADETAENKEELDAVKRRLGRVETRLGRLSKQVSVLRRRNGEQEDA